MISVRFRLVPLIFILLPASGWTATQSVADTPEAQFQRGMALAQGSTRADGTVTDPSNYVEAAKLFRQAADRGLAAAQRSLGQLYLIGLGVTKSESEAGKWFEKAAEQGDARAQTALGRMYAEGRGVGKNERRAVSWFQKAADQSDAEAQFYLGSAQAAGRGVPRNPATALDWYRKAASQGFPLAEFALGMAYEVGFGGFEMSLDEAAAWYTKAESHGLAAAKAALQGIAADIAGAQRGAPTFPSPLPSPSPATGTPPQPIRGDAVVMKLIYAPRPSYPAEARAARVSGVVLLQAVIAGTGRVRSLKILKGHPLLNEAAMDAVRQWRYSPQTLNGQPIDVLTTVTVNFSFQ